MKRNEVLRLYRWLAATYPNNYRGLTDDEVRDRVDNLYYAFDGYDVDGVIAVYRTFLCLQKQEPSIAEVLQKLRVTVPTKCNQSLDYAQRLRMTSGYTDLERQYGQRQTRRTAAICTSGTVEELAARLASGDN